MLLDFIMGSYVWFYVHKYVGNAGSLLPDNQATWEKALLLEKHYSLKMLKQNKALSTCFLSKVLQVDRMVKERKLKISCASYPMLMKQLKYKKLKPWRATLISI